MVLLGQARLMEAEAELRQSLDRDEAADREEGATRLRARRVSTLEALAGPGQST